MLLTRKWDVMGALVNTFLVARLAGGLTAIVVVLNAFLIFSTLMS